MKIEDTYYWLCGLLCTTQYLVSSMYGTYTTAGTSLIISIIKERLEEFSVLLRRTWVIHRYFGKE